MWWRIVAVCLGLGCGCRSESAGTTARRSSTTARATGAASVTATPSGSASARTAAPNALVVRTTSTDLVVQRPGAKAPLFSYEAWARAAFARYLTELAEGEDGGVPRTTRDVDVTPVSLVGTLLALREHTFTTSPGHEAHPAGETRLVTLLIDEQAATPLEAVSISDYFDERSLDQELRSDPRVKKALRKREKPDGLAELVSTLAETEPTVGRECYAFPPDLLRRFTIDHVIGDRTVVRFGLAGAGTCREELVQLELFLPTPAALSRPLADARSNRGGFLAVSKPPGVDTVKLRFSSDDVKRN